MRCRAGEPDTHRGRETRGVRYTSPRPTRARVVSLGWRSMFAPRRWHSAQQATWFCRDVREDRSHGWKTNNPIGKLRLHQYQKWLVDPELIRGKGSKGSAVLSSSPRRGTRCIGRGAGGFWQTQEMTHRFRRSAPSIPDLHRAPTTRDPRVFPASLSLLARLLSSHGSPPDLPGATRRRRRAHLP